MFRAVIGREKQPPDSAAMGSLETPDVSLAPPGDCPGQREPESADFFRAFRCVNLAPSNRIGPCWRTSEG